MRIIFLSLLLFTGCAAFAQSARTSLNSPDQPNAQASEPELTVKQMFDDVNGYVRAKAAEYDTKKVPFSDKLLDQTKLEQRQLSAKYAAVAAQRKDLAGDDHYYLGMLHWIAENLDGTVEALRKYIAFEGAGAERRQTSRSIIVVALAKQKKLIDTEMMLAEYLKNAPVKLTERTRMEGEIAKAYQAQRDIVRMAPHAAENFKAAKLLLKDPSSRSRSLDGVFDAGILVFEAYRDLGDQKSAEEALEDLRVLGSTTANTDLYYYAVDRRVKYLIETGRKPQAQEYYLTSLLKAEKAFDVAAQRTDILTRLKKREKYYKLLGEAAPELQMIDQWFPGTRKPLADLRGRVVLLDFWATWCGPCYEAFPALRELHRDHASEGLVILGVTKYYGRVNGLPAANPEELVNLKQFRDDQKLPYDFVVAKDAVTQLSYAATSLPTTVLIDKRGTIRYLESGTSSARIAEIQEMVKRLLAEKF